MTNHTYGGGAGGGKTARLASALEGLQVQAAPEQVMLDRTPPEIVLFASYHHARSAGFKRDRRHRQSDNLVAWWPELGADAVRGPSFARVTVTDALPRSVYGRPNSQEGRAFREAVYYLREQLRIPPMIWIDL